MQVAADKNTARNGIERQKQQDKRNVFFNQRMGNGMYACSETKGYDKRRQKQQRPKRGNFAEVMVPNTGEKQRSECDRQENQGKRQTPKQAGGRAVKIGCRCREGGSKNER